MNFSLNLVFFLRYSLHLNHLEYDKEIGVEVANKKKKNGTRLHYYCYFHIEFHEEKMNNKKKKKKNENRLTLFSN